MSAEGIGAAAPDASRIGPTTPDEREGGMMHLNHSCEPNLGLQGQIV
jgi:hypothetical protein